MFLCSTLGCHRIKHFNIHNATPWECALLTTELFKLSLDGHPSAIQLGWNIEAETNGRHFADDILIFLGGMYLYFDFARTELTIRHLRLKLGLCAKQAAKPPMAWFRDEDICIPGSRWLNATLDMIHRPPHRHIFIFISYFPYSHNRYPRFKVGCSLSKNQPWEICHFDVTSNS